MSASGLDLKSSVTETQPPERQDDSDRGQKILDQHEMLVVW